MHKPTIALALLSLPALGSLGSRETAAPPFPLKDEAVYVEYTATADRAVVVVDAESEQALDLVEIRDPAGNAVLRMRAMGSRSLSLSGLVLETQEDTLGGLFGSFPEGRYLLRGRTAYGQPALGSAELSHQLLPAPSVTYPAQGDRDVPVTDLVVTWASDPRATGYRVILEQNENDGLTVELPAGSESFRVPDGYLLPGTATQLEVGARGSNGNVTLVEVLFGTL